MEYQTQITIQRALKGSAVKRAKGEMERKEYQTQITIQRAVKGGAV